MPRTLCLRRTHRPFRKHWILWPDSDNRIVADILAQERALADLLVVARARIHELLLHW